VSEFIPLGGTLLEGKMFRKISLGGFSSPKRSWITLSVALVSTFVVASSAGAADGLSPQQQLAFDIYKESWLRCCPAEARN